MPDGGDIRVSLRKEGNGGDIVSRIEDEGSGVPEEIRDQMFHPFFTTKTRGTGLGLATVRRIVEDHGGRVEIDTSVPKGAAFHIRFPGPASPGPDRRL